MALFGELINDLIADPYVTIIGGCPVHPSGDEGCLHCQISVVARWDAFLARRIMAFANDRSTGNWALLRAALKRKGLSHMCDSILSDLNRIGTGECPSVPDISRMTIATFKQVTTKTLPCSASNRLYHNDVDGFAAAMGLVILMCEQERYPMPVEYAPSEGGRVEFMVNESLDAYAQIAKQCRQEYATHGVDLSELWQKWESSPIEELRAIGEALRTGDYHGLAI